MIELFLKMLVGSAETAEKALSALLALFGGDDKLPSWGRVRRVEVTHSDVKTMGHMMAGIVYELGHYRDGGGVDHIVAKGVTPWQIDVGLPPLESLGRGLQKIEGIDVGLFRGDIGELKGIVGHFASRPTTTKKKKVAAKN